MQRSWLLLGMVILCLAGCMRGYDYTIDYRNRFVERLKSFENKRAQIRSSFALVFETLDLKLKSPAPNFRNLAWEWEARMRSLKRQVDDIQAELVKMDTLSKHFYRQLHEMTTHMKDSVIKERERYATELHEKDWKKWRAYAKRNIDRAYRAIKSGEDAHKVFVSSGIRTKRETAIKTMQEVRHNLFGALRRLERFANATSLLMSLEQEDLIPKEIRKMEKRRRDVEKGLATIAKTMTRQLTQKDRLLQEISWSWENDYLDVRYELESLADDFDNVKNLTQAYYNKSAYHIEKIVDPTIREEENEEQKAHQAKLDKIYGRITKIRDEIAKNFRFADDNYQALINAARRRQISHSVEKLTEIKKKIDASLLDLKGALADMLGLFVSEKQKAKNKKTS